MSIYIFRVCVVTLSTQRECAILSNVASPAQLYFSTLSHKRHDFRKKKNIIEHKCVF